MKTYVQAQGVIFSGKIKEIRALLSAYARRYRTVKDLIGELIN